MGDHDWLSRASSHDKRGINICKRLKSQERRGKMTRGVLLLQDNV